MMKFFYRGSFKYWPTSKRVGEVGVASKLTTAVGLVWAFNMVSSAYAAAALLKLNIPKEVGMNALSAIIPDKTLYIAGGVVVKGINMNNATNAKVIFLMKVNIPYPYGFSDRRAKWERSDEIHVKPRQGPHRVALDVQEKFHFQYGGSPFPQPHNNIR